ncbi:MAG TPA: redoxin [Gammaproteobacteria bacterium]|nr:redoxin [Gammaproteobacteria bacterium]
MTNLTNIVYQSVKRFISLATAVVMLSVSVAPVHAVSTGEPAPSIILPHLQSKQLVDLEQYKGKVVYLDFWASWCGTCRISMPQIEQLHQDLKSRGFEVVGINVDQDPEAGRAFLAEHPVSFATLSDPKGVTPQKFELIGMPTSYLIDAQGLVRLVHQGFRQGDVEHLRHEIEELLMEVKK